jgi:lipid II:glycine glycyltransferase (peptidoglycan interpeptide bridge formation enzyme)
MTVIITILDNTREKSWDDLVLASPHGTIFHTVGWLKLVQQWNDAEFLPLMFYQGTTLVAIYPMFIKKQSSIKVALSPPSRSYMLYLGPVIADYESLKQDKKESTYIQIQQVLDTYIFKTLGCKYARIRSSPGLYDSRPLKWSGYVVDPYYTYRIDLTKGIDYVWEQFEKKLRVKINKTIKEGVTVRAGEKEDLEFVHDSLYKRYTEQGISATDYKNFLLAIYQKFFPDTMKIFVAEYEGQKVSGNILLCHKKILYSWVGLSKTQFPSISPNDLIQWETIKWAQTNGFEYFEMMDSGDDPRLRPFKSKYNPDLVIWYGATKYSSFIYKAGEKLFSLFKK